jgi:hypothetical protein
MCPENRDKLSALRTRLLCDCDYTVTQSILMRDPTYESNPRSNFFVEHDEIDDRQVSIHRKRCARNVP